MPPLPRASEKGRSCSSHGSLRGTNRRLERSEEIGPTLLTPKEASEPVTRMVRRDLMKRKLSGPAVGCRLDTLGVSTLQTQPEHRGQRVRDGEAVEGRDQARPVSFYQTVGV